MIYILVINAGTITRPVGEKKNKDPFGINAYATRISYGVRRKRKGYGL